MSHAAPAIGIGDPLPDVSVVTIHGETAALTETRGAGGTVLIPIRGPW